MEYIEDYSYFGDVPVDFIIENIYQNYPHIESLFKGKDEILID